jgi:hypothetical protein
MKHYILSNLLSAMLFLITSTTYAQDNTTTSNINSLNSYNSAVNVVHINKPNNINSYMVDRPPLYVIDFFINKVKNGESLVTKKGDIFYEKEPIVINEQKEKEYVLYAVRENGITEKKYSMIQPGLLIKGQLLRVGSWVQLNYAMQYTTIISETIKCLMPNDCFPVYAINHNRFEQSIDLRLGQKQFLNEWTVEGHPEVRYELSVKVQEIPKDNLYN